MSINCTRFTAISLCTRATSSLLLSSIGSKLDCTFLAEGQQMSIDCSVSGKTNTPCVLVNLLDCTGMELTFQRIVDIRILKLRYIQSSRERPASSKSKTRQIFVRLYAHTIQMMHDGQCDNLCPEVKMSTRGRSPSVHILTEGHIILEWRTMNIMNHMFCRMPNCDKKIIGE